MCTESNYDRVKIRFSPKINNVHVYIFRLFVVKSVRASFPVFPVPAIRRDLSVELTRIGVAFAILGRSCKQNSQQQHILRSALFPATLIAAWFLI